MHVGCWAHFYTYVRGHHSCCSTCVGHTVILLMWIIISRSMGSEIVAVSDYIWGWRVGCYNCNGQLQDFNFYFSVCEFQ